MSIATEQSHNQFICFFDSGETGCEEHDRVPIAVGTTREEAIQAGIPRMLEAIGGGFVAMQYGSLATVAQPDLSPDDFEVVRKTVDDFFARPAAEQSA